MKKLKKQTKKQKKEKEWKKMIVKADKELAKAIKKGDPEEIAHWEREQMMVTDELSFIENDIWTDNIGDD